MSRPERITIFVDVDDTLIDTQAAKRELDSRMAALVGAEGSARWWALYEAVRTELGGTDIPFTLGRYHADEPDAATRAAFADLFMRFPFAEFAYPAAFDALAHLRELGTVAILSDGDPIYQTAKIVRSGLAAAVDGFVFVCRDKLERLADACAALPADHYVLVDDKPRVLERARAALGPRLTTVFVRQGRYAATAPAGGWPGADHALSGIEGIGALNRAALLGMVRGPGDAGPA